MTYALIHNKDWMKTQLNGIPTDIPADWGIQKISESTLKSGRGQTPQYVEHSNAVVVSQKCLGSYTLSLTKARTCKAMSGERGAFALGDILLASTGEGTLGKCAIANTSGYCDSHVTVLRFAHLASGYLFHTWARKNFVYINNQWASGGTKQTELKLKNVLNHEWVAPPLPEQTAIANILSDQEALIAHYADLIALHEKRFAYLSDELLSGRLRLENGLVLACNKNWKMVRSNGVDLEIPADWLVKKLQTVFKCLDSKRKPLNSKERSNKKGSIPYWGANSIVDYIDDYLIDEDVLLLGEDAAPFFDKSKKVAFASSGKIWPNNHVHVLKAHNIDFSFGVHILNSVCYENIMGISVRPKLTQSTMQNIDLVLPPISEQIAIANVLSDQEKLIEHYKTLRDAEQKRFDWLSNALLTGTYRVKLEE